MKDSCGEDSEEVRSNVEKSYIPQENAHHQKQTICRDRDLKATAGSAPRLDLENVALERSEESKEMPPEGGRGGSRRIKLNNKLENEVSILIEKLLMIGYKFCPKIYMYCILDV